MSEEYNNCQIADFVDYLQQNEMPEEFDKFIALYKKALKDFVTNNSHAAKDFLDVSKKINSYTNNLPHIIGSCASSAMLFAYIIHSHLSDEHFTFRDASGYGLASSYIGIKSYSIIKNIRKKNLAKQNDKASELVYTIENMIDFNDIKKRLADDYGDMYLLEDLFAFNALIELSKDEELIDELKSQNYM